MKSRLTKEYSTQKRMYPYLGIADTNKVVLFTAPREGMVVVTGNSGHDPIGYYCSAWIEEAFTVYQGEVILSN